MSFFDANPLLLPALVALFAGALALMVVRAIRRALFGKPGLQPPRCAACGSLVRGEGAGVPSNCSECGRATDAPGALHWTRLPRWTRWRALIASVMSIVVVVVIPCGIGALVIVSGAAAQRRALALPEMPKRQPTVEEMVSVMIDTAHAQELLPIAGPLLDNPQELDRTTARDVLAGLARSDFRAKDGSPVNHRLLARLGIRAFATSDGDEQLREQLARALPHASCHMTPTARPGSDVFVALAHQTEVSESWMKLLAVRVNGVEQPLSQNQNALGNLQTAVAASFTAPTAPGNYDVEIDWWADWPLRGSGADETQRGLAPQRETTKRTLVVSNGPELLREAAEASSIDFRTLIDLPYITLMRNGSRVAVWLDFPNVLARMDGTWSIEIDGKWTPLIARDETYGSPFDVVCVSFVDAPHGDFPETVRVRFEPSSAPVTAVPTKDALRALERYWSEPFECTMKRTAWPYPKSATYRFDSMQRRASDQKQ